MASLTALVADDSLSARELLGNALQQAGFTVTESKDGDDAWQLAISNHYDIVLADLYLPKLDGIALTSRLRQHPDYITTPILAVSSNKASGKKEAIREAGASGLIRLPITPAELLAVLQKLLPV